MDSIRQNMHKMIQFNILIIFERDEFMYMDSAYYHNSRLDFKEKEHPLFVSSCGTYHLLNKPKLPTHRPRGRLDYQILYSIRKSTFLFSWTRKNCNRRQYRDLPPQRRTTLLLLRC